MVGRTAALIAASAAWALGALLLSADASGTPSPIDFASGGSLGQSVLRLEHAMFAKTVRGESSGSDLDAATQPWQPRSLPDLWRRHGGGDWGYGWYRLEFQLATVPTGSWAMYLPFANSTFDARVNGSTIAVARDFDALTLEPQSSQPQFVAVPVALLRQGINRVDIRLRVEQDIDGGLSAVDIGPRRPVEERYLADRFWRADLPRALDFTLLVAAVFMLLLWLRRPGETLYAWFAALCAVWALRGFYTAGGGSWLRALHRMFRDASHDLFLASSFLVGCALLLVVVDRYAQRPQPRIEYSAMVFGVLVAAFVAPLGRFASDLLNPAWYVAAAALAALAVRTIATMTWRAPNLGNVIIAAGAAFMLAMALHDVLVATQLVDYTPTNWLVFGPPVLLATVVVALGGRYFHAFDEAGRLNRELEGRVAERARDIEHQYERISVLERRQAVADERERLMRDMHDGIGSELMTTLNAVERGTLPGEQVGELLRACIEDLRLVIDSLDAGETALGTALANLRYRLEPRLAASGLQLDWRVDPQAGSSLAPEAVLHVLRVVQEALTNALKHADATHLAVRVQEAADLATLDVEVSDDGKGLVSDAGPRNAGNGRGLANMRQRAQSLGGGLQTSTSSAGTCVTLRIPMVPNLRDAPAVPP